MFALRRPQADDGAALHAFLSQPNVARWLRPAGVTAPFTPEECERIAGRLVAHHDAHGFGTLLAWDGATCIGWSLLQYTPVDGRPEVEIGWAMAEERWGRGLGTELGQRALTRAREHGFTGVVAWTRVDNSRSRRVMEKLGLRYERDTVHAGLPHVLYREPATG